jgi:regulator of sigma E protease
MSLLIFIVVLVILILVHEWGHFIAAKKTGMRVDEFGIGFPPKVFSVKKGETEYSLNSLPIGGFVRIYGENLDDVSQDSDRSRSFSARPKWAQAIVLVAGVFMNVVLAWAIYVGIFMSGMPTQVDETSASSDAQLFLSAIMPGSPLAETIKPGTQVLSISSEEDRIEFPTPTAFRGLVEVSSGQELVMQYRYAGEEGVVNFIPQAGLLRDDPDRVAAGVALSLVEEKNYGFFEAMWKAADFTWYGLKAITIGLTSYIADAFVGRADLSQVAGPVGIYGMVSDAAATGWVPLLMFTAIISLHLAVLNLLPFPALDGGRLVFVAIESITRKPINPVWAGRINALGMIILLLLIAVVTWSDIMKLLG